MEKSLLERAKNAWNAFQNKTRSPTISEYSYGYGSRPGRVTLTRGNEKSIVASVFNRIALDCAAMNIKHCRINEDNRFIELINSRLNNCLTLEANIDQNSRNFIQDIVISMFDEGCVAVVPTETTANPNLTDSYDIYTMRTGRIIEWQPRSVKVELYNDKTGNHEEIWCNKRDIAIIENPLYSVINEHNSVGSRLMRKLSLLDSSDEKAATGKLDLFVQLPFAAKTETQRKIAEQRLASINDQLNNSRYGIAYIDATEKITQLNRSLENNLMKQIEYLTNLFFSQLGITQTILDGTADEQVMLNYNNRTIEPIVSAITIEFKRKFLTQTARTQGQSIEAFRDPFRLVPVNQMAEIADKFTRNEILSSNEIRQAIGMKPSEDPKADELINSNISQPMTEQEDYEDNDGEEYYEEE